MIAGGPRGVGDPPPIAVEEDDALAPVQLVGEIVGLGQAVYRADAGDAAPAQGVRHLLGADEMHVVAGMVGQLGLVAGDRAANLTGRHARALQAHPHADGALIVEIADAQCPAGILLAQIGRVI